MSTHHNAKEPRIYDEPWFLVYVFPSTQSRIYLVSGHCYHSFSMGLEFSGVHHIITLSAWIYFLFAIFVPSWFHRSSFHGAGIFLFHHQSVFLLSLYLYLYACNNCCWTSVLCVITFCFLVGVFAACT